MRGGIYLIQAARKLSRDGRKKKQRAAAALRLLLHKTNLNLQGSCSAVVASVRCPNRTKMNWEKMAFLQHLWLTKQVIFPGRKLRQLVFVEPRAHFISIYNPSLLLQTLCRVQRVAICL